MLHGWEVEKVLHQALYTLQGGTAEPSHLQIDGRGLIVKILTLKQNQVTAGVGKIQGRIQSKKIKWKKGLIFQQFCRC